MGEGLEGNPRAALGEPLIAVAAGDVADGQIQEERRQRFDATAAAVHRAGLERGLGRLRPTFRECGEGDGPVFVSSEVSDLRTEFGRKPLSQLAVCGSQRPAKLLVTPLDQRIIACRLERAFRYGSGSVLGCRARVAQR